MRVLPTTMASPAYSRCEGREWGRSSVLSHGSGKWAHSHAASQSGIVSIYVQACSQRCYLSQRKMSNSEELLK